MLKLLIPLVLLFACQDEVIQSGETDSQQRAVTGDIMSPDVQIVALLPDITVDAYVDPCEGVQNTDDNYCQCHPRCCQQQTWYCPPRGTEILAKEAILDICGDDYVPCDRSINDTCPPAEIIFETGCTHAFDCPPGINEDFTMYYDCEIEGRPGTQEVVCDKGRLSYGECISCYSSDEVCDGQDNDCDDLVDENQLNECGECGQLPPDTCDNIDNDCDGQVDEDLIRECVTACERGVEVCEQGSWIGCTAQQPYEEACDGFDSDCDGRVDEGLNCQCPPEMVGALLPCAEPPLSCGMGFKTCECDNEDCTITKMSDCLALCAWLPQEIIPADSEDTCDETLGMPVEPEMCNNFDEDCDQLIDENLEKACYSGPEGTGGIGVCTPGNQICQNGQWYGETSSGNYVLDFCAGEVVPSREICDGADNDCDGTTDFGQVIPDTDILFILDWSGSMEYNINAVIMAMTRFATQFSAEGKLKWGLITGPRVFPTPGTRNVNLPEYLRLDSDITDFSTFMSAFSSAGAFESGSSSEMLRDAIYLSVRSIATSMPYDLQGAQWGQSMGRDIHSIPELKFFRVNWRTDADRIIILFTDENDQSYMSPKIQKPEVVEALGSSPNTKLYAFTNGGFQGRTWDDYVNETGGERFELSSSADQMYEDLMSILDDICLGSEEETAQSTPYSNSFLRTVSSQVTVDYVLRMCY